MFEDHLDLRALREERVEVVDAESVVHANVEPAHDRNLCTIMGTVTVERFAYRQLGSSNLHPADAVLNLPTQLHSQGLRRLAAIESTRGSFDDASQAIKRATGVPVAKRQVEALAAAAAADVEDLYAASAPEPAASGDVLVISVVGKGIVMRPDALRPARRDADHHRCWVALVDGNNHQIDRINTEAENRKLKVTIVVDLIHVMEYLWSSVWCFFAEGDRAAEDWVRDKTIAVLEGNAGHVAAGIRRRATTTGLTKANVLKLRAVCSNGDFDKYWTFHLNRERQRVHESRYAHGVIPLAA